ncbi:hypothetical protein Tco_1442476 [Tanacetum coccineum]
MKGFEQSHSVSSGTVPDPQDLERNIQLASTRLPSTLDEGTRKSQPLPESTTIDPKDSVRNKQPIDTGLPSTTSDEGTTKTTPRPEGSLRDKDSGGNIPPADIGSATVGEDMDKDPQAAKEVRTPSPKQDQPEPSHVQESTSDSSRRCQEFSSVRSLRNNGKYEEASVSYADLKASIEEYYDENVAYINQTDKLVESTMSTIDKSSTTIKDLYKGMNVITKLLKDINTAVKDDPATNKKIDKSIDTFAKISTNTTEVRSLIKDIDFSTLQSTVKDLQAHALKQEKVSAAWTMQDTLEIKSMMMEIYQAFKGQSSLAPSSSVTPTLVLTNIPANIKGENATNTATEEPHSYTEGETEDPKIAIPISSIQPTESDEDPSKKLVPASTIVRPDPDEEVKVPYMINGKMCYLTDTEMQAYMEKEEKLRKAAEEARLLAISKPEVIKVVQKEAKKIGLDPKKIASTKAVPEQASSQTSKKKEAYGTGTRGQGAWVRM